MKTTVYKDVPAKVYTRKGGQWAVVSTKAYRRIMDEAERAMRTGGWVDVDIKVEDRDSRQQPQPGGIKEWITATIHHQESTPALPVPSVPRRQRRQFRLGLERAA